MFGVLRLKARTQQTKWTEIKSTEFAHFYQQQIWANAYKMRIAGCLGLSLVISTKIHSSNMRRYQVVTDFQTVGGVA